MQTNNAAMLFNAQQEILAILESQIFVEPQRHAAQESYARFEAKISGTDFIGAIIPYFTKSEILVLPIAGAMSRNNIGSGFFGNAMLTEMIVRAAEMPEIKGLVLDVYSGGGTVDSTKALSVAVANFPKPSATATAFACSAAYWAISGSDLIFMEDQSASEVGSLGTIYYRAKKQPDVTTVEIMRSKKAVDKAKDNPFEDLDEATRADIQRRLDASEAELHGAVRLNRVGRIKSDEIFTGKTYGMADAIRLGLADRKGTLANAVAWVRKQ